MTRRELGVIATMAATATGCSLLVHFDDASCLDGGCIDGSPDSTQGDGPGADAPSPVETGVDAGPDPCTTLPDGAVCAYAGACQCQYCAAGACSSQAKACPQGFNWEAGVDMARCCSGLPVLTDTNANCGVCGVACATAGVTGPQDCALLLGHYQCVNCTANNECWSGCCAIDTTPYHCSESDCNTGACVAGLCPAPSVCVVGGAGATNYCSYD
jgi:hypothetical protein